MAKPRKQAARKQAARKQAARKAQPKLSHVDARGRARMVDISDKDVTERVAIAAASVRMQPSTLTLLLSGKAPKGDVLAVARVAAIQAAKRTPELIPLCHQIALTSCTVEMNAVGDDVIEVRVHVRAADRTGAEMEALVAASIGALTIYDMLKAVDRGMTVEQVQLLEKTGGNRGDYKRA